MKLLTIFINVAPLHKAVEINNSEIVSFLVSCNNIDLNIKYKILNNKNI